MYSLTVGEFAAIDRFADAFRLLYGEDYQYGIEPKGVPPHDSALNALAVTLVVQTNRSRLESFCNALAGAINGYSFNEGYLTVEPMHELLAERLGLPTDTPMFAVFPKQGFTDVVCNAAEGRERWLRARLFQVTREGIAFVPFDLEVVMQPYLV